MNAPPQIEILLPVYNEAAILNDSLHRLDNYCQAQNWPWTWRLVILANGCSDQTVAIGKTLARANPRIVIQEFPAGGRGQALNLYCQACSATVVIYLDIDLAVEPSNILTCVQPILNNEMDLVIGSRLIAGAQTHRSWWRELISRIYNGWSRYYLGHYFYDLQCGCKAWRPAQLATLQPNLTEAGWFWDTELVLLAQQNGWRIQELPVDWRDNRYQTRQSKVKLWRDIFLFIQATRRLKKRLKSLKLKRSR